MAFYRGRYELYYTCTHVYTKIELYYTVYTFNMSLLRVWGLHGLFMDPCNNLEWKNETYLRDLRAELNPERRSGKPLDMVQKDDFWVVHNQREALFWFERLQPAKPNKMASVRSLPRRSVQPVDKVASVAPTCGTLLRTKSVDTSGRQECEEFNLSAHPNWPPTAKLAATRW